MKQTVFVAVLLVCFFGLACKAGEKKEGSRFNRLDETSPEYQAKAVEHLKDFYFVESMPVDSIKVEGAVVHIKVDSVMADSFYRAYASATAIEYYKFKQKTALVRNISLHVYCSSRRGLVAEAVYP
jgi:hypothetical protein